MGAPSTSAPKARGRILSGMRPTGKLHLGNFAGALENWVKLQGEYENFHMVADWHALTTDVEKARTIAGDTWEMVLDWIAAGIDPMKSPIFIQSHVKEHAELHLLFSMLVTVGRLERNPTLKEQVRDLGMEEKLISYGHLGYVVLQAADILIYRANLVPVGEDQVPHVELTREIARRFNGLFGQVFPEPEARLTAFKRLPGLDRQRMSKSIGNTILLSDSPAEIKARVQTAYTDPAKVRKHDPGHPEGCMVYCYHTKFNEAEAPQIEQDCKSGALGCVDCKANLSRKLADYFQPFREKREALAKTPDVVRGYLEDGTARARKEAETTMAMVHDAMGI